MDPPIISNDNITYVVEISESPTQDIPMIVEENADIALAPVIIEELGESEIMDIDLNEFIETNTLKVCQIHDPEEIEPVVLNDYEPDLSENDDIDNLTPEEENKLANQFLDGKLSFSEYYAKMDRNTDFEITEEVQKEEVKKIQIPKTSGKQTDRRKGPGKRKRRYLPAVLQGLMGTANLKFADGDIDTAVSMCMEIIRQAPYAPEPFKTLANIYELTEPTKALQFELIAAHLSPKDVDMWIKLAEDSLKSDPPDRKQATMCYTKAIQARPKDLDLYKARATQQELMGDKRAFQKGYLKFINQLDATDGHILVPCAKDLTRIFMAEENYEQALQAMEQIFHACPNLITLEEINIICEILIVLKKFHKCLDILNTHTEAVVICQKIDETDVQSVIVSWQVPDTFIVDLRVKLIICFIELDYINEADELSIQFFANEDPNSSGDLFLDIVDSLIGKQEYSRALKFLDPLINSSKFSLPAVWLRYAECWVGCKELKKAILSYEIVTKLSPEHLEARIQLSTLYKCFRQYDLALDILDQDMETQDEIDVAALYQRTLLLYNLEKYDEFLTSGMLLVWRHTVRLRTRGELDSLTKFSVRQRIESLDLYRLNRAEPLEDENKPQFNNVNEPSLKEEFKLFLKMCQVACKLKKYGRLERMCFTALTSRRFEPKTGHIMFLCLLACIYNNNSFYAYNLVRELVRGCHKSNLWNLLDIVIQRGDDSRHNRFLMRLLSREDAFSYRYILNANNCLVSGTYKYALNDYVFLFKREPGPLLALLIGVTFLQMACQKFSAKKHHLITQAYAFFKKYEQMRGPEGKQEANYNIGRALHQLGLLSGALHFYKLVLDAPTPKLVAENSDLLDLKKETAFNVHLIYIYSGNYDLAKMYLDEYIVI